MIINCDCGHESAWSGKIFSSRKIKMKSKSKIEKQMQRKTSENLVKTIVAAKKNKAWFKVAEVFSGPRKNRVNLNLEEINKKAKEGETIVVMGKVLSQGEIDKKIKVVALSFSERAKEKLKKAGCEVLSMVDEIKKNPAGEGIKIL